MGKNNPLGYLLPFENDFGSPLSGGFHWWFGGKGLVSHLPPMRTRGQIYKPPIQRLPDMYQENGSGLRSPGLGLENPIQLLALY